MGFYRNILLCATRMLSTSAMKAKKEKMVQVNIRMTREERRDLRAKARRNRESVNSTARTLIRLGTYESARG